MGGSGVEARDLAPPFCTTPVPKQLTNT